MKDINLGASVMDAPSVTPVLLCQPGNRLSVLDWAGNWPMPLGMFLQERPATAVGLTATTVIAVVSAAGIVCARAGLFRARHWRYHWARGWACRGVRSMWWCRRCGVEG